MNNNTEAIYDAKQLGTGKVLVLGLQHMFAVDCQVKLTHFYV